jgi:hypothetical protein
MRAAHANKQTNKQVTAPRPPFPPYLHPTSCSKFMQALTEIMTQLSEPCQEQFAQAMQGQVRTDGRTTEQP